MTTELRAKKIPFAKIAALHQYTTLLYLGT